MYFVGMFFCQAQENNCSELLEYRNNNLVVEYKKSLNDYRLRKEHVEFILNLKEEIIDNNSYATSGFITGLIGIKTAADAIYNTLSLVNVKGVKNATKLGKDLYNMKMFI